MDVRVCPKYIEIKSPSPDVRDKGRIVTIQERYETLALC